MSKIDLAVRMADELGVSVSKASRFIDDVGVGKATSAIDDVAAVGSKSIPSFTKVAAGGGALGAGALLWRQQDVETARSLAQQSSNYREALTKIVDSDLPPDVKKALLSDLGDSATPSGGDDAGNKNNGGNGLLPSDPQTLIVLMIVLIFALKFGLDGGD